MTDQTTKTTDIAQLIAEFGGKDIVEREAARQQLVAIGTTEVRRALERSLEDPSKQVRWEAAKTLAGLADSGAIPSLLKALDDDDEDVRWVAAEAMIALGDAGLRATLNELAQHAYSLDFCKSAHHVIRELKLALGHADKLEPVLDAIQMSEPEVSAAPAAYKALLALDHEE
ncbi:MAG: HEAT repeat domain-containing protein [Planctomycetales bacterium]|nr:HEAT repeat domain-containing protein [Planctomycetales bacterium]